MTTLERVIQGHLGSDLSCTGLARRFANSRPPRPFQTARPVHYKKQRHQDDQL